MILRPLSRTIDTRSKSSTPRPVWEVFLETQKQVEKPFAIIFQAEHSRLAGRIAASLLQEPFGNVPFEVIQAISEHDFGWTASDRAQMDAIGGRPLRPFPDLSAEETLPSWKSSVIHSQGLSPLGYLMVSRHFTLLGGGDPGKADFVRTESERRVEIECSLPYSVYDLDRWTDAVGFCDIVSLYLCCGSEEEVEMPIAHPANPASSKERKTVLSWEKGSPVFSPPILQAATRLAIAARIYSGSGTDLKPVDLEWVFEKG